MTDFQKFLLILGPSTAQKFYQEYTIAFIYSKYDLIQSNFPNMALRQYYNVSSYQVYQQLYSKL